MHRVLSFVFGLLASLMIFSAPALALESLQDSAEYYQLRYGLRNVFDKRVDNHGNGYENLYGVRNFRTVLNGAVYRGGANNAFNRHGVRSNSNPLPSEGLNHLCEEGFDQAIYLYPTRYNTAPKSVTCRSTRDGSTHTLTYLQVSPLAGTEKAKSILRILNDRLNHPSGKPIFLHCWNGWHASGFISALALRQFCGVSGDAAVSYWNRNTDGNNKGSHYDRIRERIRSFKPYPEFSISDAAKRELCLY